MFNRLDQQHRQEHAHRRKGLDLQCSNSAKKKPESSNVRISTNPSPGRFLCFNNEEDVTTMEHTRTPTINATNVSESRVIIRQNELVEFAKKFALEKADYEDRLEEMRNELARHEASNRRSHEELRRMAEKLQQKELHEKGMLQELQSSRKEQQQILSECREQQHRAQQFQSSMEAVRSQHLTLTGQLELALRRLGAAEMQIGRLEEEGKENARSLGERVYEVISLKQELETTKQSLRERQIKPTLETHQDMTALATENANLKRDFNTLARQFADAQLKIDHLQQQLHSSTHGDLQRRVGFLEQENMRLKDRLVEQLTHSQSSVLHQNTTLAIELTDRNKRIFELSSDLNDLRRQNEGKYSRISQSPGASSRSSTALARCTELENQVERLNRQLIEMRNQTQMQRPISHFEDITLSNVKRDDQRLENVREADELRSESSRQPLSESQSMNKLNDSDLENLCQENEHMRSELHKLGQISAEHKALQQSIRSMEGLIDNLRRENSALKSNDRKKVVIRRNDRADQPKILITPDYSQERQEENQHLKQQCEMLRLQLANIKEEYSNQQTSRQDRNNNSLGLSSLSDSRPDRLSYFLRKIAEYSREIVTDRESPLEFELYSTIFNKFLRHIETLERERGQPKSQQESVLQTNDRPASHREY